MDELVSEALEDRLSSPSGYPLDKAGSRHALVMWATELVGRPNRRRTEEL